MVAIQLETLDAEIWGCLGAAALEREDPFRTPAVATVGLDGIPQVRVVVLRAVEPTARTLAFHTDVRSSKLAELRRNQAVTWLFYDAARSIQLRATSTASVHTDDAEADRAWAASALASRASYVSNASPGSAIAGPVPGVFLDDASAAEPGRRNFGVVQCRVSAFDVLQLHRAGHRRARVVPDGASWLAP